MYQPALDASNLSAMDFVARMLARHGRGDEAFAMVLPHASDQFYARLLVDVSDDLADVLARHDRHDELRALIDGYGKEYAAHRFALHLESVGQVEGAITLLAPMAPAMPGCRLSRFSVDRDHRSPRRLPAMKEGKAMRSIIKSVSFDATDALALARFWAAALGTDVDGDSTPEKAFVEAAGWGGPNIWFTRVKESKTAKNRVHFDLRAPGPMTDEVARLEKLGATVIQRFDHLVSMRDPEGNEFCVEPGPSNGER